MPLILAFDTAGARCAAALFDGERELVSIVEPREKGHAERLFPLIGECLAAVGRAFGDIGLIAVCAGPGNFTGVRIGVAAARGLALSTGAPAIGVDRFEALAEGREGALCVALKARGGALHLARFENGVEAMKPETLAPEEGAEFARDAVLIGDGAELLAAAGPGELGGMRSEAPLSAFARVAARKLAAGGAPRPAPRYLRPANAALPREAPAIILP